MALIEIHIHTPDDGELSRRLTLMESAVQALQQQGAQEMQTLKDVQDAVAAEKTVEDSAITLLTNLAAQVAALAPTQAAIDQLATDIKAQTASLATAVTANTPAGTTPPPPPPADGQI